MTGLFRVQDELSASSYIIAYRIVPVDRYYTRTREIPGSRNVWFSYMRMMS